jgi:hypothetical protein
MALDYRLTLAGELTAEEVARRAMPVPMEISTGAGSVLHADLRDSHGFGFTVSIAAGSNGYFDAPADGGLWVWEPEPYVAVGFRVSKVADHEWTAVGMLGIVRRVLEAGTPKTPPSTSMGMRCC